MDVRDILNPDPPLGFRFGVFFIVGGARPNPIDIRFQKVSGLSADISTDPINEGGQNLFTHRLPSKVSYNNLVLQRGMVVNSPLNIDFTTALSHFQFAPCDVLVTLYSESSSPLAGWLFMKAYPVKWSVSDLDANESAVVIDTMELAYTRFQIIRV